MNSELFKLVVVDPISRRIFEELKSKQTFTSIKEAQTIDLCAMLNEYFLRKIPYDIELELKKNYFQKGGKRAIDPSLIKNIDIVLENFCIKTSTKHIKELSEFEDSNLSDAILAEAATVQNNQNPIDPRTLQIKTIEQVRELRNQLSFKIPEFLTMHDINYTTYIKNVHNFYIFSTDILDKRLQLQKKEKDLGYPERFERTTHPSKEWEPQGFLVKTIFEHKESVTCLDISTHSKYFASASDGGEIKLFDVSKLDS